MASGASILATCATCPFYRPVQPTQGECRANPPTPFLFPGPPDLRGQPQAVSRGFWAPVGLADYCGKHPRFGEKLGEHTPAPLFPVDVPAAANGSVGEAEHAAAQV